MNRRFLALLAALTVHFAPLHGAPAQEAPAFDSPHKRLARSCEACHVATSFKDIRFDHDTTDFSLEALHEGAPCLACHNVEDFSRVDDRCVTCHTDIHRDRMGPDCARCHTPRGWTVFDSEEIHAPTNFPILGRHTLIDCLACHPGSPTADFRRVWTECVDCHQQEFIANPSIDHVAFGFSSRCQDCHEMTGWTPSYMPDHDPIFPIYSGRHKNTWDRCTICHVDPNNRRVFECITCHEHNRTDMDAKHQGIPGYAYVSQECYACHPTGEAGDFGEHDTLFFPIFSGAHRGEWASCTTCHDVPADRKQFTCITCHEHDRTRMDDKHLGEVQDYVYASNACYECHPTGRADEGGD